MQDMPHEVMGMIFEFTIFEDDDEIRTIRRVCKRWHDIANTTPCLWTTICIQPIANSVLGWPGVIDDRWPLEAIAKVKHFLERAGQLPLTFNIDLGRIPEVTDVPHTNDLTSLDGLILTYSQRWESLRVMGRKAISEPALAILSQASRHTISTIYVLHGCSGFVDTRNMNIHYTPGTLFLSLPETQEDEILSRPPLTTIIKKATKVVLAARNVPCVIATLGLDLTHLRVNWGSLSGGGWGSLFDNDTRVTLRSLISLTVEGEGEGAVKSSHKLFCRLLLPELSQFAIDITEAKMQYPDEGHWFICAGSHSEVLWRSLAELVKLSGCTLETLAIRHIPLAWGVSIAQSFWEFANLQTLVCKLVMPRYFLTVETARMLFKKARNGAYPFDGVYAIAIWDKEGPYHDRDEVELQIDALAYILEGRKFHRTPITHLRFSNLEDLEQFGKQVGDLDAVHVSLIEKADDWCRLVEGLYEYDF